MLGPHHTTPHHSTIRYGPAAPGPVAVRRRSRQGDWLVAWLGWAPAWAMGTTRPSPRTGQQTIAAAIERLVPDGTTTGYLQPIYPTLVPAMEAAARGTCGGGARATGARLDCRHLMRHNLGTIPAAVPEGGTASPQ